MGQQRAEVEESAAAVARGRSSRGGPRSAGRVLSDMEKADAAKALRLQKLRAEVEEGERLHETFTPVLVARPESARSAAARSSAGPAHERLYALRPSTAGGASTAGRDGNVGNVHRTPRTAAAGGRPLPSRAAGEPASAPVAEDLYRDAEERRFRHYESVAAADAQAHHERNASKLSARSVALARRKGERQLRGLFDAVGASESGGGGLTREQLPDVLRLLGLLRTRAPPAAGAAATEAEAAEAAEEAALVTQLWVALSGGDAAVPFGRFADFMLSAERPPSARAAGVDAVTLRKQSLAGAHKATGHMKARTAAQLQQAEEVEYPFTPSVRSAPRTPRTAAPPASSIFDALYDRAFSYAAKKERLRVERSESAMEECTFTPHINRGAPTRWEKLENLRTAEPPVEAAE